MKRLALLLLTALIVPACGNSDSGMQPIPAPTQKPAAIVPEPIKVAISTAGVKLDGSKSFDPAPGAPALQFLWEQVDQSGVPVVPPTVTLATPTAALATFTAPGTKQALYFRLTVTGAQGTDSAIVTVKVKTFTVVPPDQTIPANVTWFLGYGKSGTITPVVSGTPANPKYTWSGLEGWLPTGALNTLAFSYGPTPALTEFQNFPDRAGVLLMERTTQGRLQLKIRVTDDNTSLIDDLTYDEAYINFSVGPFADSVANENVALGEPVFLNGGQTTPSGASVTTWTWDVRRPNGTAVQLVKPDKTNLAGGDLLQRYVYFVPDIVGPYTLTLIQNAGPSQAVRNVDLTCGTYVGVGNLVGTTPDPFKGECAACHAGQLPWLADFANPWKQTAHAQALKTILDPADPFYTPSQAKDLWINFFNFGSEYSIDSRSLGWSRIATKPTSGWAEMATTEGCVLKGTTWDELVRKHPKTAGKSNVQCESCHGPGSEHAGDSTAIRKSYDANVCGRCHSTRQDAWEASAHSHTKGSPAFDSASGNTSCNGCHTAQGFVVEMRAQETANPHPVLFGVGNIARPALPVDDRRGTTCQACHEPHKKTFGRPAQAGPDPQLRAYGDVKFRNDAVSFAGEAATCYMCHQSRRDSRTNSPDWNNRQAPHDSTAGEMLAATNGMQFANWIYNSSPHANPSRFLKPGQTEVRQCLSCHLDSAPLKGDDGYGGLGGHSFAMAQGDGTQIFTTAAGIGSTVAGTRKFTFAPGSPLSSFLRKVYPGDQLDLTGTDAGTYFVDSVDSSRQITLRGGGAFTGGPPVTSWAITSVKKYNSSACTVCHPMAPDFRSKARGDYDGNGTIEPVQDEIQGLITKLKTAIEGKVADLLGAYISPTPVPVPVEVTTSSKIKYKILASGAVRTFPGPTVPTSEQPDIVWSAGTTDQAGWNNVYMAAYNMAFVVNDLSNGVHNTGYAVNLLQSSYKAVTGSTIAGSDLFIPY